MQLRLDSSGPFFVGKPLSVEIRPELSSYRGQLLSGETSRGKPVHAAAFIRERRIILEEALLAEESKSRLIFLHELFHFAWVRLGNTRRHSFAALLNYELESRARGELGESSLAAKEKLKTCVATPGYACESFCDTGAWFYSQIAVHKDFILAQRWRKRRHQWFETASSRPWRC